MTPFVRHSGGSEGGQLLPQGKVLKEEVAAGSHGRANGRGLGAPPSGQLCRWPIIFDGVQLGFDGGLANALIPDYPGGPPLLLAGIPHLEVME